MELIELKDVPVTPLYAAEPTQVTEDAVTAVVIFRAVVPGELTITEDVAIGP